MKAQIYLPEDVMVRRALEALMNTLGPVEMIRFLTLPRQRQLDTVQRHRQLQASLDKDRFLDQILGVVTTELPAEE